MRVTNAKKGRNSEELKPDKFLICLIILLHRQDLNLGSSGFEPNQFSVISVAAFSASNVYI